LPAPGFYLYKQNFITRLFQKLLVNKDIRIFKKNFFYYVLFRLVRKFLNARVEIKIHNFKLSVSQKKNTTSHFLLKKCDFSEIAELELIKRISDKNRIVFLDGGCNYGFFSFFVATLNKKNDVISVDASTKTCDEFRENLRMNTLNNITLMNNALSDKPYTNIKFYQAFNDWESSAISSGFIEHNAFYIETITIDEIFKNRDLKEKKFIMKLDLEGFEIQAISGSRNVIKKYKPLIIIELSKYIIKNSEFDLIVLEKFLNEENYLICDLKGKIVNIKEIERLLNNLDEKHQTIGNFCLVYKSSNMLSYI
tara:strand:- start:3536 stop:4462 length:927 start_codon:yes stop_codon:yes gene_type:complete